MADIYIEAARIQQAIENHLGIEGELIFDFEQKQGQVQLNLLTINRRHQQSFLFRKELGINKLDALQKMLDYVRHYKNSENSYTIQWRINGEKELQTSYFRAKDMYDALDKLYYNRDIHAITVYSLVLNPIA